METTIYRRPLPDEAVAFSSPEGRRLFAEALIAGGLDGYFPLAEQFHTQQDPAFCGLGSLVVALNALAIDPGRLWKGPWRWFGEELLDCCVPLPRVRERGLDLDELACLARCNGAEVRLERASETSGGAFRDAVGEMSRGSSVMIASYDRAALGQTGGGHFSPVAGYHAARDLVLILDVARFKYPPHWIPTERLWHAMRPLDPTTGQPRGWLQLRARPLGVALGYSFRSQGESWQTLASKLRAATKKVGGDATVEDMARAVAPLADLIEVRIPTSTAHQQAVAAMHDELMSSPLHAVVTNAVGPAAAQLVTMLLLASAVLLHATQRAVLDASAGKLSAELESELGTLRAQVAAVCTMADANGCATRG